mgnify:CR=1 FL=1
MDAPEIHPWDMQPDEPVLWFGRFELYRRMGPDRSVLAIYQQSRANKGKERLATYIPGAWTQMANRWKWRERAEAWDRHQQAIARQEEEELLPVRRKAWLEQFRLLQTKAMDRIRPMIPSELRPKEALDMLVEGVKYERLALGEPDTIAKTKSEVAIGQAVAGPISDPNLVIIDVRKLSSEQLAQLESLLLVAGVGVESAGASPSGASPEKPG